MSYSASSMLDDNKPSPDPRYEEWDKRSRKELADRLYEAVDKRRDTTEALIPQVVDKQLDILGINNMMEMNDDVKLKYSISLENVIKITYECIDKQIDEWKGLRWWRFNEKDGKNVCDSYNKWFKKAKCWQDQNQYKPLGRFWCLIFDELNEYISNIANNKFSNNTDYANILQKCIYTKCIEAILKGQVRFQRTRETPLLPIRVLTESKEIQKKLNQIDNGFTLSVWKKDAVKAHKIQKQKNNRSNVATVLNQKCLRYATNAYNQAVQSLNQMIPSLNIDFEAIENDCNVNNSSSLSSSPARIDKVDCIDCIDCNENIAYGPVHDGVSDILRVESQRYSPTYSTDAISVGSNRHYQYNTNQRPRTHSNSTSLKLEELSKENEALKREVAAMKKQLSNKQNADNNMLQHIMTMQQHFQMMMTQRFLTPNIPSHIPPHIPPHFPPSNYYHHYQQYPPYNPSISRSDVSAPEMPYNDVYDYDDDQNGLNHPY